MKHEKEEVMELARLLNEYVTRHQISNSLNILDRETFRRNIENINEFKCIKNFVMPIKGWPKKVTSSNAEDSCYWCKKLLNEMFPLEKCPTGCKECYLLCMEKYLKGEKLRLTKRNIRRKKSF